MAEYIKLEPLREEIFNDDFDCDIINHFLNIVDSQPTADVVEVVRCKDCQHARQTVYGNYHCLVDHRLAHEKTDYCSYGEKKEGE